MLLAGINHSHLTQGCAVSFSLSDEETSWKKNLPKAFIYSNTGLKELTMLWYSEQLKQIRPHSISFIAHFFTSPPKIHSCLHFVSFVSWGPWGLCWKRGEKKRCLQRPEFPANPEHQHHLILIIYSFWKCLSAIKCKNIWSPCTDDLFIFPPHVIKVYLLMLVSVNCGKQLAILMSQ